MDTATRNARADRIHRLWMRATGNFREASARYDMANAAFDEAAPLSASRTQARRQMLSAISAMDHWNRRSASLARAEIATVLGGAAHA